MSFGFDKKTKVVNRLSIVHCDLRAGFLALAIEPVGNDASHTQVPMNAAQLHSECRRSQARVIRRSKLSNLVIAKMPEFLMQQQNKCGNAQRQPSPICLIAQFSGEMTLVHALGSIISLSLALALSRSLSLSHL